MAPAANVDEYLAALPDDRRAVMAWLRKTIRAAAPVAVELISYGMPAFKSHGRFLVSYDAHKKHYSLYPASEAVVEACGDELTPFLTGKGTISFKPDNPLPADLVTKIVQVRLAENEARSRH
jgi:uncharacterized protein YdhG (YjbR/CyaY superfamily)